MTLTGVVVAGLLLSMPVGLVETVVTSSGLSEIWPAAAPPLGWTARLTLSGFGALMVLGLVWAGQGRDERERDDGPLAYEQERGRKGAPGVGRMGFALSKLSWLARSREETSRTRGPALRRADAHPDAPARAPIYASRDFGGIDIFGRTAAGRDEGEAPRDTAPEQAMEAPAASLAIPGASRALVDGGDFVPLACAPLPDDAMQDEVIEAEFEDITGPAPGTDALSITELTVRLERGLALRKRAARPEGTAAVIADMPVEPAVPVRDHVEQGADEALRAALGTLRMMTARGR